MMQRNESKPVNAQLLFALGLLVFAGFVWLVFIRPVPKRTMRGTISHKVYKPAGEMVQFHAGDRHNFRLPTTIPVAESYLINIIPEGQSTELATSVNIARGEALSEGAEVLIEYEVRGIPGLGHRIFISDVQPIDVGHRTEDSGLQ